MVDRESRSKVVDAIRAYMNDGLSQSEYDDVLMDVNSTTTDDTLINVNLMLWGFYSDFSDEPIQALKAEWDFYNRIILLLQSDGELVWHNDRRVWNWGNPIAIAVAVLCALLWFWQRNTVAWIEIWIICSLAMVACRKLDHLSPTESSIYPFESVKDIARLRRPLKSFPRQPYRTELEARCRIMPRHWFGIVYDWFGPWNILAIIGACFPDTSGHNELVLPA